MRARSLVLAFLLLVAGAAAGGDDEVRTLLAGAAAHEPATREGMAARIGIISGALLGRPYLRDALGEGAGAAIDADPLFRLDGFDCVTYVETVLALARSSAPEQVQPQLLALRYYGGQPSFARRTHLPTLDWLPHAVERGVLADVSAGLFPQAPLASVTVQIDRHAALRLLAHGAGVADDGVTAAPRAVLRYVRLQTLLRAADRGTLNARIPDGTVAMVVGPHAPGLLGSGIAEAIYHLGFVVRARDGVLLFRSATPAGGHRVRDVPLAEYLLDGARGRVMLGLVLLRPLPPA